MTGNNELQLCRPSNSVKLLTEAGLQTTCLVDQPLTVRILQDTVSCKIWQAIVTYSSAMHLILLSTPGLYHADELLVIGPMINDMMVSMRLHCRFREPQSSACGGGRHNVASDLIAHPVGTTTASNFSELLSPRCTIQHTLAPQP